MFGRAKNDSKNLLVQLILACMGFWLELILSVELIII